MIKVNGKTYQTQKENITILELLKERGVKSPDMVSVQINGTFVKRENFGTTVVKEKDQIDFLYFMSGGSYA
ncbi:MAG: sulfur carrier protein ThiS [Deltaproteobacteria bacterium]|nr:sulfur carrier protein ThiS [Deltaproteobacteria bacterium]MBW2152427.1 sulfur carrier protein ThiS [Deltaproteobacteria bacterium]